MSQSKQAVSSSFFEVLRVAYLRSLEKNPIMTKSLTSGFLNALGDQIAQTIQGTRRRDLVRSLKYASFGALVSAPMIHYWYRLLEYIFKGKEGMAVVILKLVIDQAIFSPVFFVIYYIYMGLWDGNMHEVPKKISKELIPVSIDSAKVWVPVQYINFKFVPEHLRVLFGNIVALGWNTYFSIINNSKK